MFSWYKKIKYKLWYSYMDNVVNAPENMPPIEEESPLPEVVEEEVSQLKVEEVLLAGPINDHLKNPQPEASVTAEQEVEAPKITETPKKKPGRPKGSTTKSTTKKLPPKA